MSRLSIVTSSVIALLAGTALSTSATAQQTLRQQLVGTWLLQSCDFKAPFCPGNGSLAFGGNGRYTEVIFSPDRPKIQPGQIGGRANVAPEQYKAIGQGTVANFGTWSVDEASKTLTQHVENNFFGAAAGSDTKYSISLNGDELKVSAPTGSATWKKSPPPPQQVAQAAAAPTAARTLKQQVQGAWNLVSCDAKIPFCDANPSGSVSYNGNGRYTMILAAKNRPVPAAVANGAAPGRDKITPEEYKAIAQSFVAQYGTWSVNEADKTINTHKEDGIIPTSTDGKATIVSVTADEMKTSGLLGNTLWRRFK